MTATLATDAPPLGGPAPSRRDPMGAELRGSAQEGQGARKPIMVDFWADWCGWCHRLDKTTYVDPVVVRKRRGLRGGQGQHRGESQGGRRSRSATTCVAAHDPVPLPGRTPGPDRLNGFQGPGQFPRTLATGPRDRDADHGLGSRHRAATRRTRRRWSAWAPSLRGGVVRGEPRSALPGRHGGRRAAGPSRKQTRMLLAIIQNYDRKYAEAEALLKEALAHPPRHRVRLQDAVRPGPALRGLEQEGAPRAACCGP